MAVGHENADEGRAEVAPARRLRRAERREQLLAAATEVFARAGGCEPAGLDDLAAASGVTRVILYRHFESKADLYEASIDRAAERLRAATTDEGQLSEGTLPALLRWAAAEPAAFRLLFQCAAGDPRFGHRVEQLRSDMIAAVQPLLAEDADAEWARWGARLATAVVIEGVTAWLEDGRAEPEQVAERLFEAIAGVQRAIQWR